MTSKQKYECLWPNHTPDFERLRKVLTRQGLPDRVPFIELFADPEVVAAVMNEPVIRYKRGDRQQCEAMYLQRIRFCYKVGWDFVWMPIQLDFKQEELRVEDTAALTRGQRKWVNESQGLIQNWEDFEGYPWPQWDEYISADFEFVSQHLPEGMQIIPMTGGILEWVMWLMGFVPFSLALYEQPDLIQAMFERIGGILGDACAHAVQMPCVGAFFLGDDMGFRTGTFIKPAHMRQYVFPYQKKLVEFTHAQGLPFALHSCGNLELVMEDLIEDVGIDAKHSFEDAIMPIGEVKQRYGDRIAILGGVDVDMLTRASEEEVRTYTRRVLEECMPGGGYALGTGNSVANYIPVRNYLAMLDEGMQVGWYTR
jgi:uroporphyrinogen decarboxylase